MLWQFKVGPVYLEPRACRGLCHHFQHMELCNKLVFFKGGKSHQIKAGKSQYRAKAARCWWIPLKHDFSKQLDAVSHGRVDCENSAFQAKSSMYPYTHTHTQAATLRL